MLKKRTTLILGAGASAPYGYPLGVGLRDNLLSGPNYFESEVEALSINFSDWMEIRELLWTFQRPSVDEFMREYPEHAPLMKLAIAYELNLHEEIKQHTDPNHVDPWYRTLLDEYLADDPELGGGLLTIVTFNYDLSLEQYLFETSKVRYRNRSDDDRRRALQALDVQHIHGHIGPLQDVHGTGRRYGKFPTAAAARAAASNISTCFEAESNAAVENARRQISESEAVRFLGFGYSQENLKRLDLKSHMRKDATVVGSTYGVDASTMIRAHLPEGMPFGTCSSNPPGLADGLVRSLLGSCC